MTQLPSNRAAVRFFDGAVLALLIACSMAEFAAAQTAMEVANRRRALLTQNSAASSANLPDPSNLGAINAAVDAEVDRRLNTDRQSDLLDPSLAPLRLMAPNMNGEDDSSAETQPATPTPSNGGGAKYPGFTAVPLSTSNWNPGSTQSAPVSRGQFPTVSSREYRLTIHRSDRAGSTDTTSPGPTPISSAQENPRRTQVYGSNLTGLRKARRQQEIYLKNSSKLYLSELECRAKVRQQRVSTSRHDPTQSYRKSLEAIR